MVNDWKISKSSIDESVAWFKILNKGEMLECRYVKREVPIVYISSMYGCDQACRMCHLTQSGQTSSRICSSFEILEQVEIVLDYIESLKLSGRKIHVNFMARGEPIFWINKQPNGLLSLKEYINSRGYHPVFKVSTILPNEYISKTDPSDIYDLNFNGIADIYYSSYSSNVKFRKKWLPKAASFEESLDWLKLYQSNTGKIITIHHAYIEGENDSYLDIQDMFYKIKDYGLYIKHNVVRFNPYLGSKKEYRESDIVESGDIIKIYKEIFPNFKIKIKDRVGFDVKASCGMFMGCSDDV